MTVEQRLDDRAKKYWIKPGKEVAHREFPKRKMIVEDILKKNEKIYVDGLLTDKQFVVGVECHWFDETGRYDRGKFLTTELIEFGEKEEKKKDKGSFPLKIPSTDIE